MAVRIGGWHRHSRRDLARAAMALAASHR